MARVCTICSHVKCGEMDAAIIRSVPLLEVSRRFNVKYDALRRHKQNHLVASILEAKQERKDFIRDKIQVEEEATISIIDHILQAFFDRPEKVEDATIKDAINLLELKARLTHESERPPRVEIRWGIGLEEVASMDVGVKTLNISIPVKKEGEEKKLDVS